MKAGAPPALELFQQVSQIHSNCVRACADDNIYVMQPVVENMKLFDVSYRNALWELADFSLMFMGLSLLIFFDISIMI